MSIIYPILLGIGLYYYTSIYSSFTNRNIFHLILIYSLVPKETKILKRLHGLCAFWTEYSNVPVPDCIYPICILVRNKKMN